MEETHLDENIVSEAENNYAGFWVRTFAAIIDGFALLPLSALYLLLLVGINSLALTLIGLLLAMIYKPYMEYRYGATLGKMALGIKVLSEENEALTSGQAVIRYTPWMIGNLISIYTIVLLYAAVEGLDGVDGFMQISELMSGDGNTTLSTMSSVIILVIGISVAFDSHKRGLHDKLAKTICVYKEK
jgi:uncharacterized RDD family membrane protein YckC